MSKVIKHSTAAKGAAFLNTSSNMSGGDNSIKNRSAQERADRAIGITIEAIQEIGFALHAASVAIMYYIPAKGAEPKEALRKLGCVKQHCARALYLIDEVKQPPRQKKA